MNLHQLHLQYNRLLRHHESALRTKDKVSFLDLAHTLRVWADMKVAVTRMAQENNLNLALSHHTFQKSVKQSLRGATHMSLPLAAGVESLGVQVSGLRITNRALTPEEIMKRAQMGPPKALPSTMNFSEWLATGIFEVPSSEPNHPHVNISRETLIRRVANILGASHPAGMESDHQPGKEFDPYILELHAIELADGFPATYYQLLEIAGEILARAKCLRDIAA